MEVSFESAYLVLTLPFVVFWFLFFAFSKKTRKQQLIMSLILLPAGTISELFYFQDYWSPGSVLSFDLGPVPILLEDLVFSFCFGGVASVAYILFWKQKLAHFYRRGSPSLLGEWWFIILLGTAFSVSLFVLGVNSIFASSIGNLLGALLIILNRRELAFVSFYGGLSTALIMLIGYSLLLPVVANDNEILQQGWFLYGTSLDIRPFGVPLTEMVWAFATGAFIGPLYEYVKETKKS